VKNILAIDTSTDITYVSFLHGEEMISVSSGAGQHDLELSLLVQKALNGCSFSNLDRVVVGAGPGSFTGLRIGFSFAHGIAQALTIPLESVISLQAYAEEFINKDIFEGSIVVVLADARRNEYFFASYSQQGEIEAPKIVSKQELDCYLDSLKTKHVKIAFTGDVVLPEGYEAKKPTKIAEGLISLALRETLATQAPLYIRKVAAKTIAEREAEKL